MKKLTFLPLMLLTLVAASNAQSSIEVSGSASYGFESEFVFRGFLISGDTFTPSAEGSIINGDTSFYAGVRTALPTQKVDNNHKMHEYYMGAQFAVSKLDIDVGLSNYDFLPLTDKTAQEANLALSVDVLLNPTLYVYYDFDGEMTTIEGSIGHAIPLSTKTAINLTAMAGTSDYYVGSDYYGAMLDLKHSFTKYAHLSVGGRVMSLKPDEEEGGLINGPSLESDTRVWWGVSFTAGF